MLDFQSRPQMNNSSKCNANRQSYEGSVPGMRKWPILLYKSDLKWCKHLSILVSLFLYLKLYCRYLYTRALYDKSYLGSKTTMTSGEWTCFIFICNGSVDLFGTGRERKIQNENICLQRDSNPHPASPRKESRRLRPLGHEGLMVISGLMSNRIMGYEF